MNAKPTPPNAKPGRYQCADCRACFYGWEYTRMIQHDAIMRHCVARRIST